MDPSKVIVPSLKTTAVVENLTPASAYHFRILAENSIGLSEPSDVIQITTHEEGNLNTVECFRSASRWFCWLHGILPLETQSIHKSILLWMLKIRVFVDTKFWSNRIWYRSHVTISTLILMDGILLQSRCKFRSESRGRHSNSTFTSNFISNAITIRVEKVMDLACGYLFQGTPKFLLSSSKLTMVEMVVSDDTRSLIFRCIYTVYFFKHMFRF